MPCICSVPLHARKRAKKASRKPSYFIYIIDNKCTYWFRAEGPKVCSAAVLQRMAAETEQKCSLIRPSNRVIVSHTFS
jgi:hypothetical protein